MPLLNGVATSTVEDTRSPSLYDILPTPYGGRGAFGREYISKGTPVLFCSAPYAFVIFWKFRREVCARCFAYAFESGKSKWSVKLGEEYRGAGGAWFCSEECRDACVRENEVFEGQGVGWWAEVNGAFERLVSQMGKAGKQGLAPGGINAASAALAYLEDVSVTDITPEFIDRAWTLAEEVSLEESKQSWKTGWTEVLTEFELDTARFVLDGLVRKVVEDVNPSSQTLDCVSSGIPGHCMSAGRWADLLELQDNELALVRSKPYILASRVRIYRFLAHLVTSLSSRNRPRGKQENPQDGGSPLVHIADQLRSCLSSCEVPRALMGRDHGNVFGIWDMATDDEGSEMLGWAAYVSGSIFNHDCAPNLKKVRNGRGIQFYALRDIHPGEELCISYAEAISVEDRMVQLEKDWFFICRCARCAQELKTAMQPT
ncbi:hypothetical protein BDZ97DRAFT_1290131 [Flammula alnicola]|nr:hypothetical protein BDZ97DRAFT_1290131 [Flammula alnicola]